MKITLIKVDLGFNDNLTEWSKNNNNILNWTAKVDTQKYCYEFMMN